MKCQNLFSGENKTNIFKCRLLLFLRGVLSVKTLLPYQSVHSCQPHRTSQEDIAVRRGFSLTDSGVEDQISEIAVQ